MKKSTIWIIAVIMGFSFLALLFLQFSYVEEMVKMKKGNIALPNGLTFPLLVANNTANVSPDVLRKLLKLANEGAVILLGEPTKHAFGLTDYPSADIETQKLVRQLWGGLDGKEYTFRNIGDGRVYYGVKPEAILKDLAIAPDFQAEFLPEQVTRPVSYLHRQDDHGNDLRGKAEIIIAKHRKGATDMVVLKFAKEYTRFENPDTSSLRSSQHPDDGGGEIRGSRMNGTSGDFPPNDMPFEAPTDEGAVF